MFNHSLSTRKPRFVGFLVMLALLGNLLSPALAAAAPRVKVKRPTVKTEVTPSEKLVIPETQPAKRLENTSRNNSLRRLQPIQPTLLDTLEVSLSDQVVSDTIHIEETHNFEIVAFDLANKSSQNLSIQELTLTGYINRNGSGAFQMGEDDYLKIKDVVQFVQLEDEEGDTIGSPYEQFSDEGKATFEDLDFRIPADTTRTLFVIGDMSPYLPLESHISIDIEDVSEEIKVRRLLNKKDIPTVPASLRVIRPFITGDTPNGGIYPEVIIRIIEETSVYFSFDGPLASPYELGTDNAPFLDVCLTIDGLDVELRQLQFEVKVGSGTYSPDRGDLLDSLTENANFTDIRVIDKYEGQTIAGPQELSTTGASIYSPDDVHQIITFTDSYPIDNEEEKCLRVTMDIEDNTSLQGELIQVNLVDPSSTAMIRDELGMYLTEIYPTSDIQGNPMTIISEVAVVMTQDGPVAQSYSDDSHNNSFLEFSIVPNQTIEVRELQILVRASSWTSDTDVDPDDLLSSISEAPNFTNLKIVDRDTGDVLMGPLELDASQGWYGTPDDMFQILSFTDLFIIDAGQTKRLKVTMDIVNNSYLNEESVAIDLLSPTEYDAFFVGETPIEDIIPGSDLLGNYMTIESGPADVSFGLLGPGPESYPIGTNDAPFFDFAVTVGPDRSVELRELTFQVRLDGHPGADRGDLLDSVTGLANFTDIKIIDPDYGMTVAGPLELSTEHAAEYSWDDVWQFVTFTDTILLDAGETEIFRITMDIENNPDLKGQEPQIIFFQPAYTSVIYDQYSIIPGEEEQIFDIVPEHDIRGYEMYIPYDVSTAHATVAFEGPVSQTYSIGARDVSFFDFSITADEWIEVRDLTIKIEAATTSQGIADDDDLLNCTAHAGNFMDIKIVDRGESGTGSTVLMGPEELSATNACSAFTTDDIYQYLIFQDLFVIEAGETKHLSVTMDVREESDLAGEGIIVTLLPDHDSMFDEEGDLVEITPLYPIEGNMMIIHAPSLALARAAVPTDDTFVRGAQDVPLLGLFLAAGEASDLTITELTLTGFIDEDTYDGYTRGSDNGVAVSDVVQHIQLYDHDGNPISFHAEEFNPYNGEAHFTGLNWVIPAGTTEKLIVKGDVATTAPYYSTDEMIVVDIGGHSYYPDIVIEDEDGDIVRAAGIWPNCGGSACATPRADQTDITITESGTLIISRGLPRPKDALAIAGEEGVFVSRYQVDTTHENFEIYELTIEQNSSYSSCGDLSIEKAILRYPTSFNVPTLLDGQSEAFLVGGHAYFNLHGYPGGDVPFRVAHDEITNFEVYVDTYDSAPSGCKLQLDFDGSSAPFEALGWDSSVTLGHQSVSDVVAPNRTVLHESLPVAVTNTTAPWVPTTLYTSDNADVYAFDITADASGSISLYEITFDMHPTGLDEEELGRVNSVKLYTIDGRGETSRSPIGQGTWHNGEVSVTMFSEEQIAAGTTTHFLLRAWVSIDSSAEIVALGTSFKDDSMGFGFPSMAAAPEIAAENNFVWSDMSAASHSVTTSDWTNGYRVENLEFDSGLMLTL